MSNDAPQSAPAKPTLWQRATNGVRNFFSHALGYIPRGVVLTGLVFAVSSALGRFDMDLLGINAAAESGTLIPRFLGHLALGSVISGVIGASVTPCAPCKQTGSGLQPSGNPLLSKTEVDLGQKITQAVGTHAASTAQSMAVETIAPGGGLPAHAVTAAAKAMSSSWGKQ